MEHKEAITTFDPFSSSADEAESDMIEDDASTTTTVTPAMLDSLNDLEIEVAQFLVTLSNTDPGTLSQPPHFIPSTIPSLASQRQTGMIPGTTTHTSAPHIAVYPSERFPHSSYLPSEYSRLVHYPMSSSAYGQRSPAYGVAGYSDYDHSKRGRIRSNVSKRLVTSPSGDPCSNCGIDSSTLWRNCGQQGTARYLCNACGLRYKKGKYCPICFQVYYDADTNHQQWKQCVTCFNWTHQLCLQKVGYIPKEGTVDTYECSICLKKAQYPQRNPVE